MSITSSPCLLGSIAKWRQTKILKGLNLGCAKQTLLGAWVVGAAWSAWILAYRGGLGKFKLTTTGVQRTTSPGEACGSRSRKIKTSTYSIQAVCGWAYYMRNALERPLGHHCHGRRRMRRQGWMRMMRCVCFAGVCVGVVGAHFP